MSAAQVGLRVDAQAAVIILFNQTFILTKLCTEGIVISPAFSPEISKVQLWN